MKIKRLLTLLLLMVLCLSLCACSVEEAIDYIDAGIAVYEAIQEAEVAWEDETIPEKTDSKPVSTTGPPEKTADVTAQPTQEPTPEPTEEPITEPTPAPTHTQEPTPTPKPTPTPAPSLDEDGEYTKKDDVALYIHLYGHLPKNFMTKNEARSLGWEGGGLDDYAYGMCIGGDRFGNYEGLLPERKGRKYTECDIDTLHKSSRGAKRIVFSNDGLIYYTDDHYESFELLYGEE